MMVQRVERIYQQYLDRYASTTTLASTTGSTESLNSSKTALTTMQRLTQALSVVKTKETNELYRFIFADATALPEGYTSLQWWTEPTQRAEYPVLHHMAVDILSIPPMSDHAERVFSGARRTLRWDRAKMARDLLEDHEVLGSIYKDGFADIDTYDMPSEVCGEFLGVVPGVADLEHTEPVEDGEDDVDSLQDCYPSVETP